MCFAVAAADASGFLAVLYTTASTPGFAIGDFGRGRVSGSSNGG
jgi:hypothetical protein